MTLFVQNDATGAGAGTLDASQAAVDLAIIANGDTGLGLAAAVGNRQQVTYARTDVGVPPTRLDNLVNTNFSPDYGVGAGPQAVPIVILPVLANFTLNNGTSILIVGGTALPPANSGLAGAGFNNTNDCLVIYDTTQNNGAGYCTARAGTGGTLDLQTPNPVILHHELSHAFRVVTDALLATSPVCNPSSPEENAAIVDENELRTQIANANGTAPVSRDPGIHCGAVCTGGSSGSCCIVASVASGSPLSEEVAALRRLRDGFLRRSEVGYAFFERLHRDYYAFSPQVCTLLARRPSLRPLVLDGFVRPLIAVLHLIRAYALEAADPTTLGRLFDAANIDRRTTRKRLHMLRRARRLLLAGGSSGLSAHEGELVELLRPALCSEHLRWAILEPLSLYEFAMRSSTTDIGAALHAAIEEWAARMPVDDVWGSLSAAEVASECHRLESTLLRSPRSRSTYFKRLHAKHPETSGVRTIVADRTVRHR